MFGDPGHDPTAELGYVMVKRPKRLEHPVQPDPCHNGCECSVEAREALKRRNDEQLRHPGDPDGQRLPVPVRGMGSRGDYQRIQGQVT